jgi:import inner membrane translocase subunit TIM16
MVRTPSAQSQLTAQAHRIITAVFVTGSRIVGRAFVEAYRQANASQKYAASAAGAGAGGARTVRADGLTIQEALKILDVPAPAKETKVQDMERVIERFQKLFDTNDPKKGGSFYLQSKILRARQRIEDEVRAAEEVRERAKSKSWTAPKMYKSPPNSKA